MTHTLRPGIAITVTAPFEPGAVAPADYCELRADLWPGGPDGAIDAIARSPRPVIFTCRLLVEGGAFRGSESERVRLFDAARAHGAALIDVEMGSKLYTDGPPAGWPVLASFHDFNGPVADIPARIACAAARGATAVKIIPTARSVEDLVTLKLALASGPPIPTVLFAMGITGLPSRLLTLTWGGFLTYMGAECAVAPGQLSLARYAATFGTERTFPRYIALAGPQADVLAAARAAATAHPATRHAVIPFPNARRDDCGRIVADLDASAAILIERRNDAKPTFAVRAQRSAPDREAAASLAAALQNTLA